MADNYSATPGEGYDFAADEVSGILWPRVKIGIGVDGSATDLAPGQETMANSVPVVIASDQNILSVTPTSLSGAIVATAVTVGTSPVALTASPLANRRTVVVYNNDSAAIYVGPSGVTTASGLPILSSQSLSIDLAPGVVLYGISGSVDQNMRVLEVS